ncbi:MAG: hypothetical protein HYY49_09395 [Ignavibacteriales bacterium]|nr:hypothetical protein [Ignavibacteriales bacterium]
MEMIGGVVSERPLYSIQRNVGTIYVSLRDLLMIDLDETERNLGYLQSYIYMVPPGAATKYEES